MNGNDGCWRLAAIAAALCLTPRSPERGYTSSGSPYRHGLIEFRSLATRPLAQNGLGMSATAAEGKATTFEATFPLLPETTDIYPAWKSLVSALGVVGKQVHDARLVAICHVHQVTHLLTFDVGHFTRMAGYGPGIVVVDPASV
jgi:hypothetical protein